MNVYSFDILSLWIIISSVPGYFSSSNQSWRNDLVWKWVRCLFGHRSDSRRIAVERFHAQNDVNLVKHWNERQGTWQEPHDFSWSHLALSINILFCKKTYAHITIRMDHFWFNIWCGTWQEKHMICKENGMKTTRDGKQKMRNQYAPVVGIPRFVSLSCGIHHQVRAQIEQVTEKKSKCSQHMVKKQYNMSKGR